MGSVVTFALIGGISVVVMLIWRLYVAISTQRDIEIAFAETANDLELARASATELTQVQTEIIEQLTQDNQKFREQSETQINAIAQLKADHLALQEKYSGLERNMLDNIAKGKTLSDTLQTYKLDNAKLKRQAEFLHKNKTEQEQEQQTLLIQHQEISHKHQKYQQLIEAAKAKISTLEKEKKQLERDLQQALYQIVALEQEQAPKADFINQPYHPAPYQDFVSEPSLPSF